jgi:hypothetical protein
MTFSIENRTLVKKKKKLIKNSGDNQLKLKAMMKRKKNLKILMIITSTNRKISILFQKHKKLELKHQM